MFALFRLLKKYVPIAFRAWVIFWPILCSIVAGAIDTFLQIITLSVGSRLLLLFQTLRASKVAQIMVSEGSLNELFLRVTMCGKIDDQGGRDEQLAEADLWVSFVTFVGHVGNIRV